MDSVSAATASRFAVTAAIVTIWYSGLRAHAAHVDLAVMSLAAGATVAAVALTRREGLTANALCRWDEVTAWIGIAAIARIFGL